MLESTFIHCQGIGPKTEQRIWSGGVRTWRDFAAAGEDRPIGARQRALMEPVVEESGRRMAEGDYAWFARRLPAREHWRAYRAFRKRIAYLDIETNGGLHADSLTVVGLYDGLRMRQFVKGDNLHEFPEAVADRALLVTFFGTGFDLPFLRRACRMEFPQLHIDLCFLMKRLGYSGGLKRVEQSVGIDRSPATRGLDGWDAVRLWREYQQGNEKSLDTLLAYNAEDVLNLETLLDMAYPIMLSRTMLESSE